VRVDVAVTVEVVVPARLAGETVLVVDVLRASTTMVTALANGALGIEPVADADEARRRVAAHPGNGLVLAGERRGITVPGFELGNSPLEMTGARVRGRTIVFTTSNGTRALLACRHAAAVAVAGLVNVTAAARWAAASGRDVTVVCAGERGARSLEDHVCAGLLVDGIVRQVPAATVTAAAAAAALEAAPYATDVGRLGQDSPWALHLRRAGRADDVAVCLALDTSSLVPLFRPDVDKVVAGPR
jgi:2-phosphosulfolactate phosphatase